MSVVRKLFLDFPVAKKLIVILWFFLLVVVSLLYVSHVTIENLSAARVYAGAAIRYALSRWAPARSIEDSHIGIDNNTAERSLRGVALGRKNYLFAGSDPEENEPRRSTAWSAQRNSMDLIPKPICGKC